MTPLYPGPAYRIVTRRLVIRCWDPADAPLLKAAIDASRAHLRPWMPWASGEPLSLQEQAQLLRTFRSRFDLDQDFIYGIFNQDETRVLGGTGLHTRAGKEAREIGYWIHVDFINQGFATETSAALTRVAFEVDGVRRVDIRVATENARSAAVPRKLGYTLEGTLRQRELFEDGRCLDLQVWSLLRDEYPATPCAQAELQAYDIMGRRIL